MLEGDNCDSDPVRGPPHEPDSFRSPQEPHIEMESHPVDDLNGRTEWEPVDIDINVGNDPVFYDPVDHSSSDVLSAFDPIMPPISEETAERMALYDTDLHGPPIVGATIVKYEENLVSVDFAHPTSLLYFQQPLGLNQLHVNDVNNWTTKGKAAIHQLEACFYLVPKLALGAMKDSSLVDFVYFTLPTPSGNYLYGISFVAKFHVIRPLPENVDLDQYDGRCKQCRVIPDPERGIKGPDLPPDIALMVYHGKHRVPTYVAICVITKVPYFCYIGSRLECIAQTYFHQKCFSDHQLLLSFVEHMNSMENVEKWNYESLFFNLEWHFKPISLCLSYRALLFTIKCIMLGRKIVIYSHSAARSSTAILALLTMIPGASTLGFNSKGFGSMWHSWKKFAMPLHLFHSKNYIFPYFTVEMASLLNDVEGYVIGITDHTILKEFDSTPDFVVNLEMNNVQLMNGDLLDMYHPSLYEVQHFERLMEPEYDSEDEELVKSMVETGEAIYSTISSYLAKTPSTLLEIGGSIKRAVGNRSNTRGAIKCNESALGLLDKVYPGSVPQWLRNVTIVKGTKAKGNTKSAVKKEPGVLTPRDDVTSLPVATYTSVSSPSEESKPFTIHDMFLEMAAKGGSYHYLGYIEHIHLAQPDKDRNREIEYAINNRVNPMQEYWLKFLSDVAYICGEHRLTYHLVMDFKFDCGALIDCSQPVAGVVIKRGNTYLRGNLPEEGENDLGFLDFLLNDECSCTFSSLLSETHDSHCRLSRQLSLDDIARTRSTGTKMPEKVPPKGKPPSQAKSLMDNVLKQMKREAKAFSKTNKKLKKLKNESLQHIKSFFTFGASSKKRPETTTKEKRNSKKGRKRKAPKKRPLGTLVKNKRSDAKKSEITKPIDQDGYASADGYASEEYEDVIESSEEDSTVPDVTERNEDVGTNDTADDEEIEYPSDQDPDGESEGYPSEEDGNNEKSENEVDDSPRHNDDHYEQSEDETYQREPNDIYNQPRLSEQEHDDDYEVGTDNSGYEVEYGRDDAYEDENSQSERDDPAESERESDDRSDHSEHVSENEEDYEDVTYEAEDANQAVASQEYDNYGDYVSEAQSQHDYDRDAAFEDGTYQSEGEIQDDVEVDEATPKSDRNISMSEDGEYTDESDFITKIFQGDASDVTENDSVSESMADGNLEDDGHTQSHDDDIETYQDETIHESTDTDDGSAFVASLYVHSDTHESEDESIASGSDDGDSQEPASNTTTDLADENYETGISALFADENSLETDHQNVEKEEYDDIETYDSPELKEELYEEATEYVDATDSGDPVAYEEHGEPVEEDSPEFGETLETPQTDMGDSHIDLPSTSGEQQIAGAHSSDEPREVSPKEHQGEFADAEEFTPTHHPTADVKDAGKHFEDTTVDKEILGSHSVERAETVTDSGQPGMDASVGIPRSVNRRTSSVYTSAEEGPEGDVPYSDISIQEPTSLPPGAEGSIKPGEAVLEHDPEKGGIHSDSQPTGALENQPVIGDIPVDSQEMKDMATHPVIGDEKPRKRKPKPRKIVIRAKRADGKKRKLKKIRYIKDVPKVQETPDVAPIKKQKSHVKRCLTRQPDDEELVFEITGSLATKIMELQNNHSIDFVELWISSVSAKHFIEKHQLDTFNDPIYSSNGMTAKQKYPNGDVYIGEMAYMHREGKGTYITTDGTIYEGSWVKGKRHGHGTLVSSKYDYKYSGSWVDDRREGHGELKTKHFTYVGSFKNNTFHGNGKLVHTGKDTYEGDFENGKYNGRGRLTQKDGTIKIGCFKNNEMYGVCSIIKTDGRIYVGRFYGDLLDGSGKLIYDNYTSFEGEWARGIRDGQGVVTIKMGESDSDGVITIEGIWCNDNLEMSDVLLKFPSGYKYTGSLAICSDLNQLMYTSSYNESIYSMVEEAYLNFDNRILPHGTGIIKYCNGGTFSGDMFNGMRHGEGIMLFANGVSYNGTWAFGTVHGSAEVTFPGDTLPTALTFHYGKLVGDLDQGRVQLINECLDEVGTPGFEREFTLRNLEPFPGLLSSRSKLQD
ncbi:MORN repeat-containing protein, putative [Babesia ovis]|uniref:MORN repeat-containing protein, putative n=1 Tax=Babesia ovis TaxID=5869 RepID=A0A9W5T961_BABOV|nr:MORN repeat-containing protein, putative [Babesia ovis]